MILTAIARKSAAGPRFYVSAVSIISVTTDFNVTDIVGLWPCRLGAWIRQGYVLCTHTDNVRRH